MVSAGRFLIAFFWGAALGGLAAEATGFEGFEGYALWKEAKPKLTWLVPEGVSEAKGRDIRALLSCPGASEYKVSESPGFEGALWRPATKNLRWNLPSSGLLTLYVVFKRSGPSRNFEEVSGVAHDTLRVESPSQKIERREGGVINWSEGFVVSEATVAQSASKEPSEPVARYAFTGLQEAAEQQSFRELFATFQSTPVNGRYTVSERLHVEGLGAGHLLDLLQARAAVSKIDYPPGKKAVLVALKLPLYSRMNDASSVAGEPSDGARLHPVAAALKPEDSLRPATNNSKNNYATEVRALILDVRGHGFFPVLYPEVRGASGRVVFSADLYTDASQPFVRYHKTLSGSQAALGGLLKSEQNPHAKTLAIKALRLNAQNPSEIFVAGAYEALLLGNRKSLNNLAKGGFFIVVD